ncbi:MAG TPA: KH domain-containing protein [Candidatus Methanomethylicus sp.]|nr:KH domain-containing protein [Candidatus Methanomethylicus sp.]
MSEETMSRIYLKIPVERAGSLIGEKGGTKVELEKGTGSHIEVDGKTGEVVIEMDASAGTRDPSGVLKARDIVNAIGRGFSPERAFRLFTDGQMLEVVDLKQALGESRSQMQRIKGRIIGENGKTRRIIESLTGTVVSVYGHTVSIIGEYEEIIVAKEAVAMLVKGAMHGSVYRYLNKEHAELKKKRMSLWEARPALKEAAPKEVGGGGDEDGGAGSEVSDDVGDD